MKKYLDLINRDCEILDRTDKKCHCILRTFKLSGYINESSSFVNYNVYRNYIMTHVLELDELIHHSLKKYWKKSYDKQIAHMMDFVDEASPEYANKEDLHMKSTIDICINNLNSIIDLADSTARELNELVDSKRWFKEHARKHIMADFKEEALKLLNEAKMQLEWFHNKAEGKIDSIVANRIKAYGDYLKNCWPKTFEERFDNIVNQISNDKTLNSTAYHETAVVTFKKCQSLLIEAADIVIDRQAPAVFTVEEFDTKYD